MAAKTKPTKAATFMCREKIYWSWYWNENNLYISMTFMPLRSNNYSNEPQGLPTHLSALVQTDFLEAHYESDGAEVQTDQTDRSPEVQGQATTRCYSAAVPNSSTPALHTYKLVGEGCWRAERCRRTQLWQSGERWSQPWSESQPRER